MAAVRWKMSRQGEPEAEEEVNGELITVTIARAESAEGGFQVRRRQADGRATVIPADTLEEARREAEAVLCPYDRRQGPAKREGWNEASWRLLNAPERRRK